MASPGVGDWKTCGSLTDLPAHRPTPSAPKDRREQCASPLVKCSPLGAVSSAESSSVPTAHFFLEQTTLVEREPTSTWLGDSAKQNVTVVGKEQVTTVPSATNRQDLSCESSGVHGVREEIKIAFHRPLTENTGTFGFPTPAVSLPRSEVRSSRVPMTITAMTGAHRPVLFKSHSVAFGVDSTVVSPTASIAHPPLLHQHSADEAQGQMTQPTAHAGVVESAVMPPPVNRHPLSTSSSRSSVTGERASQPPHPFGLSRVITEHHLGHQSSFGFTVPESPAWDRQPLLRSESLQVDSGTVTDVPAPSTAPQPLDVVGPVPGGTGPAPGDRGRQSSGSQVPGKWRSSSSTRRSASRKQPLFRSNSRHALPSTSGEAAQQAQGRPARLRSAGSALPLSGDFSPHSLAGGCQGSPMSAIARNESLSCDVVPDSGETHSERLSSSDIAEDTRGRIPHGRHYSYRNDDYTRTASVFGSDSDLVADAVFDGEEGVPSNADDEEEDEDMHSDVFAENDEGHNVAMDTAEVSQPSSHSPISRPLYRQPSRRRSYKEATAEPSTANDEAVINDNAAEKTGNDDERRGVTVEDVSEEEEEKGEHSPFLTPPGSPRPPAKSRRVDMGSFDPYQIFEVQHLPCIILTVKVLRGRNITNGWAQDMVDTPDPYIKLHLETAPEGRQRTRTISNNANPEWNETFHFFLGFSEHNVLQLTLMEENPLMDQETGTIYFNIYDRMREFSKWQTEVFNFNGISEVDVAFLMAWDQNPTLRYSLCLSDMEKEFMRKRKEKVFQGLNKLLGENGPRTLDETPTIAVIGSGGGFRAMTGYSGVFKALADTGLLDCATYACGLSGSSWYLSTLYSHARWPEDMSPGDLQMELMNNIDKSLARLLGPQSLYRYVRSVVSKRRLGQPVSFTDFFGHMVGETLLKGRLDSRLSDQREKLVSASVPMPLYTCVHVKKDVPARSFQEWVEFSPYEIGMPKYGTFMDSKYFGSKFFMGKLVKAYDELPLHFLQGMWGSAFCILFKRLMEDNRNLDPAEMMRRELELREDLGDHLEKTQDIENDSSDISDDDDDEEETDETDDELTSGRAKTTSSPSRKRRPPSTSTLVPPAAFRKAGSPTLAESSDCSSGNNTSDGESSESELQPPKSFLRQDSSEGFDDVDAATPTALAETGSPPPSSSPATSSRMSSSSPSSPRPIRRTSSPGGVLMSSSPESPCKKGVRFSCQVDQLEKRKAQQNQQQNSPIRKNERKPLLKRASTIRRGKSRSYWSSILRTMFESQNLEVLNTRAGRAAVIHNFMRGLNLQQTYPLSPFTPVSQRVQVGDEFDGIFDLHPTHIKHIYMVDAGLTFNSPYPLVLRPQRGVDVILSFDFSARDSDNTPPFKELLLAEKWAKLNRLPFPPIDPRVVDREGMKELYVFRDPHDPHCPVVLHFALVNVHFRHFKAPGVRRETKEELDFADFDIFDDPTAPFSTFNFTYTNRNFRRLSQLTEFNTRHSLEKVKAVLAEVVSQKRQASPRTAPINTREIKLLRMKSVQERHELKKFLKRMESRSNIGSTGSGGGSGSGSSGSGGSGSSMTVKTPTLTPTPTPPSGGHTPPTPFFTPSSEISHRRERNPFVFSHKSWSPSSRRSSQESGTNNINNKAFFSVPSRRTSEKQARAQGSGASSRSPTSGRSPQSARRKRSSDEDGGRGARSSASERDSSLELLSSSSSTAPVQPPAALSSAGYDEVFYQRSPSSTPTPTFTSHHDTLLPNTTTATNPLNERKTSSSAASSSSSGIGNVRQNPSTALDSFGQNPALPPDDPEEDEFHDAAEAFTRDGEAVTDPQLAKMYFEGAKERRRLFRRQSTISTLNSITESISLDSAEDPPSRLSRTSDASSGGPIDVADLEQFEGIADDVRDNVHNNHHDSIDNDDDNEEEDQGDEHWFDGGEGNEHRGSVISLDRQGGGS